MGWKLGVLEANIHAQGFVSNWHVLVRWWYGRAQLQRFEDVFNPGDACLHFEKAVVASYSGRVLVS